MKLQTSESNGFNRNRTKCIYNFHPISPSAPCSSMKEKAWFFSGKFSKRPTKSLLWEDVIPLFYMINTRRDWEDYFMANSKMIWRDWILPPPQNGSDLHLFLLLLLHLAQKKAFCQGHCLRTSLHSTFLDPVLDLRGQDGQELLQDHHVQHPRLWVSFWLQPLGAKIVKVAAYFSGTLGLLVAELSKHLSLDVSADFFFIWDLLLASFPNVQTGLPCKERVYCCFLPFWSFSIHFPSMFSRISQWVKGLQTVFHL